MTVPLVVDGALAPGAGPTGAVVVAPRRGGRGRHAAAAHAEACAEALASVTGRALVLARSSAADPAARPLRELAALGGHRVLRLPDDADDAAWVAGLALRLAETGEASLTRVLEVAAGIAGASGAAGLAAARRDRPALRPRALARWARAAWRPCPRCDGGGAAGGACGRCGAPVPEVAA